MTDRIAYKTIAVWLVVLLVVRPFTLSVSLLLTGLFLLVLAFRLGWRVALPAIVLPVMYRPACAHKNHSVQNSSGKYIVHCWDCGAVLGKALEHLDISNGSKSFDAWRKREVFRNGKFVEVIEKQPKTTQPALPGFKVKNPYQTLIDEKSPPKKKKDNQQDQPKKKKKKKTKSIPHFPDNPQPAGPLPFKTRKVN